MLGKLIWDVATSESKNVVVVGDEANEESKEETKEVKVEVASVITKR